MKNIIKLIHFQLFGLLFAPLIVTLFIDFLLRLITNYNYFFLYSIPCLYGFFFISLLGWFYSIVSNILENFPSVMHNKLNYIKYLLIIPCLDILLFFCILFYYFYILKQEVYFKDFVGGIIILFLMYTPIYILSLIFFTYIIIVIAKSVKTIELEREVKFKEYIKDVFLFIIFPIGLWFLQPRLNLIFNDFENIVIENHET